MEYNDREGKYLIKLLKAVLNNEIPVPPPKDLDWPELYKLAKYHSISNIVYYAIMKLDSSNRPSEKVFKAFEQDMNIAKAREALQHFALEDVLKAYESECVKCMPLKGTIIKYLYPKPDMRSMSDIDILFEKSDRDKVKKILNSQGYKLYEKGPNHDIYIKGMIVIEMHYDLFMKSISLYDYFKAFLYRGQKKEGYNYIYESNKEDCYIYIVAHLLKHYSEYAGTGIRSFIDLWVYKNYYKEQLNKTYLNQEFSKLGISEFVDNIEGLSDMWFSGKKSKSLYEHMEKYIFSSGTYGQIETQTKRNLFENINGTEKFSKTKRRYLFHRMFPDVLFLSNSYPILEKHKVLLPIFWVIRFFKIVFNPKRAKRELSVLRKIKLEESKELKSLYEETGL